MDGGQAKREVLDVPSVPPIERKLAALSRQRPVIGPVPQSSVLGRLTAFLPQLASANQHLEQSMQTQPARAFDIEHVASDDDKPYIEMDLSCGVLELKDEAGLRAAERAMAGVGPAINLDGLRGATSDDSSDDEDCTTSDDASEDEAAVVCGRKPRSGTAAARLQARHAGQPTVQPADVLGGGGGPASCGGGDGGEEQMAGAEQRQQQHNTSTSRGGRGLSGAARGAGGSAAAIGGRRRVTSKKKRAMVVEMEG